MKSQSSIFQSPLDLIRETNSHFYLVQGGVDYWKYRIIQSIKNKFKNEVLDWTEVRATEKNASKVLNDMGVQLLGASFRGIEIKNFGSFIDKRNFTRFFEDPYIIVIAQEDKIKVDDTKENKPIINEIRDRMVCLEAVNPMGVIQTQEMMRSICREYSLSLDDTVITWFWKNSGYEWIWFENNIRRASWLEKTEWTESDVVDLCGQLSRVVSFRIANYLMDENFKGICNIVTRPEVSKEIPGVLYYLERELYKGLMIGTLLEEGISETVIRERYNIGMHQWSRIMAYDKNKCRDWYKIIHNVIGKYKRGIEDKWLGLDLVCQLSQSKYLKNAIAATA